MPEKCRKSLPSEVFSKLKIMDNAWLGAEVIAGQNVLPEDSS